MARLSMRLLRAGLEVAAAQHGGVLNQAEFARRLHISIPSVRSLIRALVGIGWVRLLPASAPEGVRDCFRRPRICLTSAPLLRVIGASQPEPLTAAADASVVESIVAAERRVEPSSRLSYFGSYDVRALDIVVDRKGERFGCLVCDDRYPGRRDSLPARKAVACGAVRRAYLLHRGDRVYFFGRGVLAVPQQLFLARYEDFTALQEKYEVWHLMARWSSMAGIGP